MYLASAFRWQHEVKNLIFDPFPYVILIKFSKKLFHEIFIKKIKYMCKNNFKPFKKLNLIIFFRSLLLLNKELKNLVIYIERVLLLSFLWFDCTEEIFFDNKVIKATLSDILVWKGTGICNLWSSCLHYKTPTESSKLRITAISLFRFR